MGFWRPVPILPPQSDRKGRIEARNPLHRRDSIHASGWIKKTKHLLQMTPPVSPLFSTSEGEEKRKRGKPKLPFTEYLMHACHSGLLWHQTPQYLRAYKSIAVSFSLRLQVKGRWWGPHFFTLEPWLTNDLIIQVLPLSPQQGKETWQIPY